MADMIPKNHILRLINKYVDFFIRSKVKHLHSNMGSPSIDPEVLIRMLLIVDIFMASLQKESYVKKSRYIPVCRQAGWI